jgi:hypothetical protein
MIAAVLLMPGTRVAAAWPTSQPLPEEAWPVSPGDGFTFAVEPPADGPVSLSSDSFRIEESPLFASSLQLTQDVLGGGPSGPIAVYGYLRASEFQHAAATTLPILVPHPTVVVDPVADTIRIDLTSFLNLSSSESENAIRYAVGLIAARSIAGGLAAPGLLTGIALYVELPASDQLGKIAALVQGADKNDTLISWFDLNRQMSGQDADLARAESYAMVAYLISRFDIPTLRQVLNGLATGADWKSAMRTAFQKDPGDLESAWRDDLPRWTTSGFRDNLMASFDLQPAKDLLASGQYVSAKAVLDPSLNLYRQLNDADAMTEVQALVGQADTGIQAEALMVEIEAALTAHDYARASNLLDQAEIQYAALPADQVPGGLLTAYRDRANQGITALGQLAEAKRLAKSWGRYPEARKAAEAAGATFASLGDADNRAQADGVITTLDNRQRRLVILVGSLALAVLVWLGLWLRSRGKPMLQWGYS